MGMDPNVMILASVTPIGCTPKELHAKIFGEDGETDQRLDDGTKFHPFIHGTYEEDCEQWILPDDGTLVIWIQKCGETQMKWEDFKQLVDKFDTWLMDRPEDFNWEIRIGANYW